MARLVCFVAGLLLASQVGGVDPRAVTLIVDFEIGARYIPTPIYPGGASGPTIGIGSDLGHQSRHRIAHDWSEHYALETLVTASGWTGPRDARVWVNANRFIQTPYPYARQVFATRVLPRYERSAQMAFGPGFDRSDSAVQGALVSLVFNRGPSMKGQARAEMRALRDCLPDKSCAAAQLRAMCRVWEGTNVYRGLCRRRHAEAALAER